jgi:hypothetical protein
MQGAPPAWVRPSRVAPGTQLNGIYEVDELIAAGGMGEVYRGHVIQTGDVVAIKVLLPDMAENAAALALFRKEASALHNLYHEAIVRYYVFTVEPILKCPYLAMEYVEGRSLSTMLQDSGPLSFESTRALMRRIAAGLQAAHERGIVHRDVSPDNIIISGLHMSQAKIIDFGIARSTRLGGEGTVIGSGFAGKYNYVSPEQLGMFGADVTAKSDIYSLGLVLAEALTGEPINMGGSQLDVVEKRRKVPDLGAVDARFRPLIERMLQPNPADRPDSMATVIAWPLEEKAPAAKPRPRTAREARREATKPEKKPRRRGKWIAIAATLLLLAGAGAAGYRYDPLGLFGPKKRVTATNDGPTIVPPPADVPQAPGPPPPLQPAKPPRVQQIEQYIARYDGGDCFFVTATSVTENSAKIEGYGAAAPPFRAFDEAFKRALGFEADIGLWRVTSPQCPAVTMLSQLRSSRDEPPYLRVPAFTLRDGDRLTGAVGSLVHKYIELLLVGDDGSVQNVSRALNSDCSKGCAPSGSSFEFDLPLPRGSRAEGQPQLLLAIASSDPLVSAKVSAATPADQVFPRILVEAARKGQPLAAAVKYFKIER